MGWILNEFFVVEIPKWFKLKTFNQAKDLPIVPDRQLSMHYTVSSMSFIRLWTQKLEEVRPNC